MDPKALLIDILKLATQIRDDLEEPVYGRSYEKEPAGPDVARTDEHIYRTHSLATKILELDEWMRMGSFSPWDKSRNMVKEYNQVFKVLELAQSSTVDRLAKATRLPIPSVGFVLCQMQESGIVRVDVNGLWYTVGDVWDSPAVL